MTTAPQALSHLLRQAALDPTASGKVDFSGAEPVLPANFLLATAGAVALAAVGLAASDLWRMRTGRRQRVGVELLHAAAAIRSDRYLRIDGRAPANPWAGISGFYRTRDGRWIQFHCNYPHHRDGVLKMLGCRDDREEVQAAAAHWEGAALEDALAGAGMCAGLVRTRQEWAAHPQGRAVAGLPVFEVLKIGDSSPEPLPRAARPLGGIRVLDLTRVIAGPVGGRTLAEQGADVLRITAKHLPDQPDLDVDTGRGKLSARLDLRRAEDLTRLRTLIEEADVFLQSYRPGALASLGLSPGELAGLRPGIVYATLSAYGHEGPWRDRRGFDSLVQSVSGIVHEHSLEAGLNAIPRHLPAQAIDYVSGYLLAFGTMVALERRAREGSSYLVRVSLAQTARWIAGLGRTSGLDARTLPELRPEDVDALLDKTDSPFGRVRFVRPAVRLAATPAFCARPPVPLGYHQPAWPPR